MFQNTVKSQKYLALGDSYTIGEAVLMEESWPYQLYLKLVENDIYLQAPQIIAKTGWTTDELFAAIDTADLSEKYDLVSLSIGVNNQYRDYPMEQFKKEYALLLEMAIYKANNEPGRVIVLSIPDYGVTPFAKKKNPQKISREIDEYNAVMEQITEKKSVRFYNITEISRQAKKDNKLLATDGLHPSGKMYDKWVDIIYEDAIPLFKTSK